MEEGDFSRSRAYFLLGLLPREFLFWEGKKFLPIQIRSLNYHAASCKH